MQSLAISPQHTETENNMLTGEESVKVRTRVSLPGDGGYWVLNLIAPVEQLSLSAGDMRGGLLPLSGLLLGICLVNTILLRLASRNLLTTLDLYGQVLQNCPAPISVCGLDNTITYMNRSALNIANSGLGVTLCEALGKPCHAVWKSGRCLTDNCSTRMLLRDNLATTHTNIGGIEYEIFTTILNNGKGQPAALCKYFRNINDLRNVEAVIDASPSGIMVVDRLSGEIVILNHAAAAMYGCADKNALTGKICPAVAADRSDGDGRGNGTYVSGSLEAVEGLTPPDSAPRHLLRSQQLRYIGNRKCLVIS